MKILMRIWLLPILITLGACAQQGAAPYAARYADALDRYPGVAPATSEPIDAFVRFFSSHGAGAGPDARDLYAPALYFSDTLLTSERHEEVVAHLERMGAGELAVTVIDTQIDGADVYLVWRMRASFTPIRNPVESDTIGVTHLRFDEAGRIVLQQDFWDSTEGFYRHLPVVGTLVTAIAGRFGSDAN